MPTLEKEKLIKETSERLGQVKGIYLADFTGMTVESISELRRRCRKEDVQFRVIKNTLLKRALNEHGITELDDFLAGPTGLATSAEDQVSPARIISGFAKENEERPKLKAAVLDGKLFDQAQLQRLAALPSREVLLQQVLGTLIAPMTMFLGAIEATLRLPAIMADVLAKEREKGAGAPAAAGEAQG